MDDVNLARDLSRMVELFRQAGARIAQRADVRAVLGVFGEFEAETAQVQDSRAGALYPDSASVESIFVALDERPGSDSVRVLQLHFKEGVTLGALEQRLGAWYRDPPEPVEVAFSSAYFNPKLVDPSARFLLRALVHEWCDRFTPHTVADSLHIDYDDERQVTDRPW